jgi:protein-disulfide isomerase
VNWQWHHLPLSMHEPAATAGARLAECAGETGGHAAFWQAVAWLYANTRGDGQGLPEGLRYPDLTPAMQGCLDSERPDAVIRAQAAEAAQQGIAATPALQLRDRESGKTLLLHGPSKAMPCCRPSTCSPPAARPQPNPPIPRHARRRCR